jgi:hypothetical protein
MPTPIRITLTNSGNSIGPTLDLYCINSLGVVSPTPFDQGVSLASLQAGYDVYIGDTCTGVRIQSIGDCTTFTDISIAFTTTTLTPTTTICQRPQGLTTFTFFSSIEVGGIPPFINFTATLLDACQALDDNINVPNTILNGLSVEALSLTVGSTIYNAFTAPDCTVVLDGYYISFDISSTEIYHVVGGILTEILTCP